MGIKSKLKQKSKNKPAPFWQRALGSEVQNEVNEFLANAEKSQIQAAVLMSLQEGVIAVDTNRQIIFANEAATKILQGAELHIGSSLDSIEYCGAFLAVAERILATGRPYSTEVLFHSLQKRIITINGNLLYTSGKKPKGVVLVLEDVTQLRQLEEMRRDFVSNVSHELKTPVASIKGFAETLIDGAINDPAVRLRFLEIILHQSDRLKSIIEDLLKLTKLEQSDEGFELEKSPMEGRQLFIDVKELCLKQASEKQVKVKISADPHLTLTCNRLLMEQALSNLLDNAIRHSSLGGSVELTAEEDDTFVYFKVKDTGEGIESSHHARLFERFYRVDSARRRSDGGSGLGLSIVKHIALVHGGTVEVKSKIGAGSTFTISIPKGIDNMSIENTKKAVHQ